MTRDDLHDERFLIHRELQELRALGRAGSRKWVSAAEHQSRKRYAAERGRKTRAARREVARRSRGGADTGPAATAISAQIGRTPDSELSCS